MWRFGSGRWHKSKGLEMSLPQFTRHATVRWWQRFPQLNQIEEWKTAVPVTRKARKKLRKHYSFKMKRKYMLSDNGVLFVYEKNSVIITVLPLAISIKV